MSETETVSERPRIILGMDPSTRNFGWAVLQEEDLLISGVIRTKASMTRGEKLTYIYHELESIIERYKPDTAAAENTFVWRRNMDTSMKLSEVRGIILLLLNRTETPLSLFQPATLKVALTGTGNASKKLMVKTARDLYGSVKIDEHEADAIAAALALIYTPEKGELVA